MMRWVAYRLAKLIVWMVIDGICFLLATKRSVFTTELNEVISRREASKGARRVSAANKGAKAQNFDGKKGFSLYGLLLVER